MDATTTHRKPTASELAGKRRLICRKHKDKSGTWKPNAWCLTCAIAKAENKPDILPVRLTYTVAPATSYDEVLRVMLAE